LDRLSQASRYLLLAIGCAAIALAPALGQTRPAERIIALSPHIVELVIEAGAGAQLVGIVAHGKMMAAMQNIPSIGDHARLDREAIMRLQPDLAITWPSGNQAQDLAWLKKRAIPSYPAEPRRLSDISDALRHIGRLTGNTASAEAAATAFEQRLQTLRQRYHQLPPRTAFFQIWAHPLYTIGQSHLINEALAVCHLQNIFSDLDMLAPVVSREAIILADPQIIIAASTGEDAHPFVDWQRWRTMQAVRENRLIKIPADLINRPTPRILDGIESLCNRLTDNPAHD
jgi:ABC-type Fe3+-hydroxamate transport system substrate-binding protein